MFVASNYAALEGSVIRPQFPPVYDPNWAMGLYEYEIYNSRLQNRRLPADTLLFNPEAVAVV